MVVEVILVGICLIFTWDDFTFAARERDSGGGAGSGNLLLILIIVVGVAIGHRGDSAEPAPAGQGVLAPQVRSARENLRQIVRMPGKAVELFGGNLASEVLFALTLGAALHAYGQSLPLMQLIVINSFASLLGGLAPIPGGMGVVEAGLIAGLHRRRHPPERGGGGHLHGPPVHHLPPPDLGLARPQVAAQAESRLTSRLAPRCSTGRLRLRRPSGSGRPASGVSTGT